MNGNNIQNNNNDVKFYDPLKKLKNIGRELSDYEEIEKDGKRYFLLGKGNFGYAEKMKSRKNNTFYAIKKLRKDAPNFNVIDFLRETENMIYLEHENIIKFYGYFLDKESKEKFNAIYSDMPQRQIHNQDYIEIFCLVLEFAQNGSLDNLYKKSKDSQGYYHPIEQDLIVKFLKQSLNGLTYLGSKSILHRDIKPDNILLDENNNIKISDFGISVLYYDQNPEHANKQKELFSNRTVKGHREFVAPEVEMGEDYDFRCDTFSLGLTILCFMSEEYPINLMNQQTIKNIIRRVKSEKLDNKYDIYLKNLVLKMINFNPNLRPYANEALRELEIIEKRIKDPNNQNYKKELDSLYSNQNNQNNFQQNNQNNINNLNQNIINQNIQNNMQQNNINQFNVNQNNNNFQFNQFNLNNGNNINNFNNININNFNIQNIRNPNRHYSQNQLRNNLNLVNNVPAQNMGNSFNFGGMNNLLYNNKFQASPFYLTNNNNLMYNPNVFFQNPIMAVNVQPAININPSNANINISKNTSLIRVFQVLSLIFKNEHSLKNTRFLINDLKKYKPISITSDIINVIDFINNNSQNVDASSFSNYINNFRRKYSMKIQKFQGTSEINPKFVFHELFSNFNKEIKDYDIPYSNFILEKLNEPLTLPRNDFPELYKKIEVFKKNYASFFVDFFYFIILDLVKCNYCNKIMSADGNVESFIKLDSITNDNTINLIQLNSTTNDNVINLIQKSLLGSVNQNYYCIYCMRNTMGIAEKKFLNSPKYLIIDFHGEQNNQIFLDNEIDLSNHIISSIGPRKYKLYGYISEVQYGKFNLCIRGNNCWKIYSDENKIETYNINNLNSCSPHIAIYQGS